MASADDLRNYFITWFVALSLGTCIFKRLVRKTGPSTAIDPSFKTFHLGYLFVYVFVMASDWLQGPYVYALYQSYGFSMQEISQLFIVGFATSGVVGVFVGAAADKFGRRFMALVFCATYIASCVTKHFKNYHILMLGRFLGGTATSLLYSVFESWMVHEHHARGFNDEQINITFEKSYMINSIVAIIAGVLSQYFVDYFGPVAPFDLSICALVVAATAISVSWVENRGESKHADRRILGLAANAWNRMLSDKKIFILGWVQSFFEGCMFIFVFMWTPAFDEVAGGDIPHGWIFADFMVCIIVGSSIFGYLVSRGYQVQKTTMWMFLAAALAMFACTFENKTSRTLGFFVFEVCVGMFWPSLGTLRSKIVPEDVRATVMNFFRIPLNAIVVLVLVKVKFLPVATVFRINMVLLLIATALQYMLCGLMSKDTVAEYERVSQTEPNDRTKSPSPREKTHL